MLNNDMTMDIDKAIEALEALGLDVPTRTLIKAFNEARSENLGLRVNLEMATKTLAGCLGGTVRLIEELYKDESHEYKKERCLSNPIIKDIDNALKRIRVSTS